MADLNQDRLLDDEMIVELLAMCNFSDRQTHVVCGVSGGPDSSALLILATAAGLGPIAVHVDHGLREGSAHEAKVVEELAKRCGADFRSESVDLSPGGDLQERARVLRKATLGPTALTGHTQDDQAETLLINLLRGAGPAGLGSMSPSHTRPLLSLRRSDTFQLCQRLEVDVVSDPSNSDDRFLRSRIRHSILPALAEAAERDVVPLLSRAATNSWEVISYLRDLASRVNPLDTRQLSNVDPLLAKMALSDWLRNDLGHPPSEAELQRVMRVVTHEVTACEISGHRRIARTDGLLRIESG